GGDYAFDYGKVTWAREGTDGVILTMGTVAWAAVDASDLLRTQGVSVGVGIVSSPLELDDEAMRRSMAAPWVLVAEDHHWRTGLWASVAEWAALHRPGGSVVVPLGVRGYSSSGAAAALYADAGLDTAGIVAAALKAARA
ncbi:MAG: transketolase, partial [Coriobacteriia bacterium]|nr:transketolase [Coriobacteriia bacterium]